MGESNPSLPRDTLHELHEILLGIASHADCAATGGAQGYKQTESVGYKQKCFRPVSNRGPFACEANVITTTLRKQALMGWWWASACLLSNMRQRVQLQLMSCSDYCGGGIWFPAAKACTGHSVAPAISAMRIFSAFKCECYSFSGNATNPAQDQRKAVHWPA